MYEINFMVYAYDKSPNNDIYSSMAIPYIFFALITNNNSHVEVIISNSNNFKKKYNKEIMMLEKINNNFLIREPEIKHNRHIPNTYRFFENPKIYATYTYITDIDIMFLSNSIVKNYEYFWPENLPYNNILRYKDSVRLTGVCMIKTKKYYTKEFFKCRDKYYSLNINENDEVILGNICKELFGLPNFEHRFRPIYGIHFSPNRGKNKSMELETSKIYYNQYMDIRNKYKELFEFEIFKKLTNQLENEFIISN